MSYIIEVTETTGEVRTLSRPYVQAYNEWKNDGVQLPDDCLAHDQVNEYNKHNTFTTVEEAQATIDWYIEYVISGKSRTMQERLDLKEHYSNPKNFTIQNYTL